MMLITNLLLGAIAVILLVGAIRIRNEIRNNGVYTRQLLEETERANQLQRFSKRG